VDSHRALSALLAGGYVLAAYVDAGAVAAGLAVVPLAVLVWLIWEADSAAAFTGNLGLTPIRRSSPAGLVRALAWAFLLAPLIAWAVSRLRPAS